MARGSRGGARRGLVCLTLLATTAATQGCSPSTIVGPLAHEQDEREHLLDRARASGKSTEVVESVFPPPTLDEESLARVQNSRCRSTYLWKNGLTWTGSVLVAIAAGVTIGAAYGLGKSDSTGQIIFGVSAGTLATLGSGLVAIGGMVQQTFSDHGCVPRLSVK